MNEPKLNPTSSTKDYRKNRRHLNEKIWNSVNKNCLSGVNGNYIYRPFFIKYVTKNFVFVLGVQIIRIYLLIPVKNNLFVWPKAEPRPRALYTCEHRC